MQNLVRKIIELSARNRFIVLALYAVLIAVGTWATLNTPLDAIPDVSDNQVIVFVDWPGRSPQLVEDQVTYPLASNLQGLPNLKAVRAQSMFGFSLVYVIFDDDVDIYWARTRVLERLNYIAGLLPGGAVPRLGPEGTGVGHVFWYTLRSKEHDLSQLRAVQDWYLKLGLQATPGVAEVASIGGFVKQYQISLDPVKMAARGVSLDTVVNAVRRSNNDVGGRLLEVGQTEYIVRGIGYVRSIADLSNIVVDAPNGVPIYLSGLGTVSTGPELRRGLLDENGTGEVVGGIIVARYGENAKEVIDAVKIRLAELEKGLPAGVTIHTAYDRSELIERAVDTLREALTEEAIIVSIVAVVFLLHVGSAATVLVGLPLSVLFSFVLMKYFGITSNIMSLGGVALAIGEIVDASIVMVENAHRHLSEGTEKMRRNRVETIIRASKQVGPAIFGSLLVMIVSFLPVFMLTGQEGKLFRPLAYTKTFAMLGASILAITLVPVMMTFFLRGRLRAEAENPVNRFFTRLYEPFLKWSLHNRKLMLGLNVAALVIAIPMMMSLGKEFMPPLDEGSLLYMPITMPSVNITEAKRLVQIQDRIIAGHPAVKYVLGKVGRAETATDPAPISMFETIVELKPRNEWPDGMTKDDVIQELNGKLRIAGVTNAWTQPIINRIDMLNTGVRTQLGVKIFGPDLKTLEQLGLQTEAILRTIPGAADLYTERISGGQYLNIEPDRAAIARYGIPVGVVLDAIETAVGGMNVTTTVEGRARFPVQVRYLADYRDSIAALQSLLITIPRGGGAMPAPSAPTGGGGGGMSMGGGVSAPAAAPMPASTGGGGTTIQLPLGQLARITTTPGPAMINSENGQLRALVQLNARGRDMGSFVDEAKAALERDLKLPAGYSLQWSGQYENQIHARKRLQVLIPLVLLIIFAILYFTLHSATEAGLVMLSVPFALIGGVYLMWFYGFNWSVAVWVGFIALYGVAVQTGVVMVLYLHEALDRKMLDGRVTVQEVFDATVEGALLRVRPKIMTVATTVFGLVPLLWATGAGSDVMKPIAVPLIGGMVTSTVHVLLVTPIIFFIVKRHELKRGRLKLSGLRATEELQEIEEDTAAPTDLLVVENVREEEEPLSEIDRQEPVQRPKRRVAAIALVAGTLVVAFAAMMLMRDRSLGDRRPLDSETVSGVSVAVAEDGAGSFALTFEDATSRQPIAVTNVSAEAVMPAMGSMPQMTVPLTIEPGGATGRYRARGKLMKGTWQLRLHFNGPVGPAQAVLEVNV
jgi:Cu(I)/Ag(I) efflux system membrane protein CusA/SilA